MTTFDPYTLTQDVGVLCHIRETFGGELALNWFVIAGGRIWEYDPVELLD